MISKEIKQESSIPVQGRVSLIVLAELASYWDEKTEYHVKTMSQLVGWSMDLLREVLVANDMLEEGDRNIARCKDYLENKGLWQKSLGGRAFKKIGTAVRFQNFRGEGKDPKNVDEMSRKDYNIMHNKHSVEPSPVKEVEISRESKTGKMSGSERRDIVKEAVGVYHELEAIEEGAPKRGREEVVAEFRKKQTELRKQAENGKVDGEVTVKEGMTDEEYEVKTKEIKERDKARLELEKSAEISEDDIVSGA